MEVCVMKGGGWFLEVGCCEEESCGSMCIGLENMAKATSNTLRYTCLSPIPLEASLKIVMWSPPPNPQRKQDKPYKLCLHGVSFMLYLNLQSERIMGFSSSLVSLSLKDQLQGNEENRTSSYGCLWSKVLAAQAKKGTKRGVRRPRRVVMKRRGGSRRGIRRRVRTLKSLVPNSDSLGLDGLFRETASYILSLQTRVRVMQVMVKVLTQE